MLSARAIQSMQIKNILQKFFFLSAAALIFLFLLLGVGRNWAVRIYADRVFRALAEKKQVDIRYLAMRMEGFSTLVIEGLTIVPRQGATDEGLDGVLRRTQAGERLDGVPLRTQAGEGGAAAGKMPDKISGKSAGEIAALSLNAYACSLGKKAEGRGQAEPFLTADLFRLTLDPSRLLRLQVSVDDLRADRLHIHFIKRGAVSNFDFLYPSPATDSRNEAPKEADASEDSDYARNIRQTLDMLFRWIPAHASIRNLCVFYSHKEDKNKGDELRLEVPSFTVKDHQFVTEIRSTENGRSDEWIARGSLLKREKQVYATLYAKGDTKITLPFLTYRWNTSVQFDTLAFELQGIPETPAVYRLRGKAYLSGLSLRQRRLSLDTVRLERGMLAYDVRFGKNWVAIDSTSEVRFNRLDFHPYLQVTKDSTWHLKASVDKNDFDANDFFASLPPGLFSNLDGLQAEGTLAYHFRCDIDWGRLDSLILESSLQAGNFHILAYGNTDLRKMNESFPYTVYEGGEPVRTFEIGPGNPSFRAFHAVSRYLPLAILQSEDAGFFYHNGFIPSAIRESLILDLKERRFARGGSTLSMQLVKNVFLSRNKTIARKLEEMLIVWLIENNRLTSKERMFEVYLNIAEWGPGIYGAAEAARFYFDKEPSQLTLAESIFLASIIPKPKHVRSCFDGLSLKPYYEAFYQVITDRMLERGLITTEEAAEARPEGVVLTGPARAYIAGNEAPPEAETP